MRRLPRVVTSLSSDETDSNLQDFVNASWEVVRLSSVGSLPFSDFSHLPYEEQSTFLSSTIDTTSPAPQIAGGRDSNDMVLSAVTPVPRDAFFSASVSTRPSTVLVGPVAARAKAQERTTVSQLNSTRKFEDTQPLPKPLFHSVTELKDSFSSPSGEMSSLQSGLSPSAAHLPPVSSVCKQHESSPAVDTVGKCSNSEPEADKHPSPSQHRTRRKGPPNGRSMRRRMVTLFSTADVVDWAEDSPCMVPLQVERTTPQKKPLKGTRTASSALGEKQQVPNIVRDTKHKVVVKPEVTPNEGTSTLCERVAGSSAKGAQPHTTPPTGENQEQRKPAPFTLLHSEPRKEEARPVAQMKSEAGTIKNAVPTLSNAVPQAANSSHTSAPRKYVPPDRLMRLVKDVTDPEVLLLIRDYIAEHYRDPKIRAVIDLCDAILNGNDEGHNERQTEPNSDRKGRCHDDDEHNFLENDEDAYDVAPGDDEFDDSNIKTLPYPPIDPRGRFSFVAPSVHGVTTSIFSSGKLYKIVTGKGEIFFLNDTLQYAMIVRVRCQLKGNEVINEKAVCTPLETGVTEITLAVLPEETMFFMKSDSKLPRVRAKGVIPPSEFVAPSVPRCMEDISKGIEAVRSRLGPWSRASDQKSFLRCCMNNNLKFTDLEFRPSAISLFRPGVDTVAVVPLTWRRPQDYLLLTEVSEVRLFRQDISCHLVRQGDLADHTVVASIAAVAQFPSHVRWMFRHPVSSSTGKRERAIGVYRVRLCVGGWWTTLLLDDYFPASMKAPLFARCPVDPRRLWVSLLEKAYAKALGSYAALCEAEVLDVMTDFTGYPYRELDELWAAAAENPDVAKTLYNYIHSSAKRHFIVMVYTPSSHEPQSPSSSGISRRLSMRLNGSTEATALFIPGHVYFITEALYYEDLDLRMVRLKNPWTWRTARSARQANTWRRAKWFEQPDRSLSMGSVGTMIQSKRGNGAGDSSHSLNDDIGTMWLEWSEALNIFAGGGVCYTLWSWHDYRIKNCFRNGIPDVVLEVSVKKKMEAIITISQMSLLNNPGGVQSAGYDAVLLLVSRHMEAKKREMLAFKSSNDLEVRSGKLTYHAAREVSLKCIFEPRYSPFYVIPRVHDQCCRDKAPFVVSFMCDTVVGGDDAHVRFCRMDKACDVFRNMPSFAVNSNLCTPTVAAYQRRTDAGIFTFDGQFIKP
ncbi:putative calpain-like cysteine peptidase [Trypanosoma grayi]|uniref:putative calpain-like cysteine peptidase n=1 Tax=Trypanosoma grayi TaxID=71804 RepID=UPI0004F42B1E|nr:putative calpain-like cysteine peptidase [Trypanosoma grayi]KEG07864.1 putative calpain-like cysteine peptidase [Trypanosoma grayi]